MTHTEIQNFEKQQCKDNTPDIQVGDTVVVHKVIVEGKKQRTQRFQGTVIKMKGSLSRRSFTVRKIIDSIGVEKTFLIHSPLVPKVEILKRSKIRRAKLYYLRDRVGAKANRLKVKEDAREDVKQTIPAEDNVSNIPAPVVDSSETESKQVEKEETKG